MGLVEVLTETGPTLNTPKAWGRGWGSRGDRAATCVWNGHDVIGVQRLVRTLKYSRSKSGNPFCWARNGPHIVTYIMWWSEIRSVSVVPVGAIFKQRKRENGTTA